MLRKMCRECAKADSDYYWERRKTGEVVRAEKSEGRTKIIVKCAACGHEWHYFARRRN